MRKTVFTLLSLMLLAGGIQAMPVDVDQAKAVGTNYMRHTLDNRGANLQLVYTQADDNGVTCLYVFNANPGYIVVAADDAAQPVLAYSEDGTFDPNNIPDGEACYLRHYARQIGFAKEHRLAADPEIAQAWELAAKGESPRATKSVGPLINLNWDQNYPYNYYCPTAGGGPGGHVYAGCVATAMSQIMKYWNWPDHGTGSYSYKPAYYPTQSANFEETYYDWNNMPISLTPSSQMVYIQAIGTLMWHCGISVDMDYAPDGSGAHSEDVVPAISNYFRYTPNAHLESRELFTKTEWEDMLIENLDEGFPVYYAAQDPSLGGHAFVCNGYNDNRYFRFNWGWSGQSNNSYYAIDALNPPGYHFNSYNRAILDFLPDYVYNSLAPVPDDFRVSTENANSKTGILQWTNPTVSVSGDPLTSIDSVTVYRDGHKVFTSGNLAPGQAMSCTDEVEEFDCYTYEIYFRTNGVRGRTLKFKHQYGPTCTWKLIGQTTNFQGWNGGKLQLLNQFGTVFEEFTLTSSTPVSKPFAMPMGQVQMKWVAPQSTVPSLTINLKNSSNSVAYTYTGSSTGLTAGVIFTGDNDCDGCLPPANLNGTYSYQGDVFGALLTWDYDENPASFKVYRSVDGLDYEEVATVDKEAREYLDEGAIGTYYYQVTAFRNHCESLPAWTPGEAADYVVVEVTSVCDDELPMALYPNPADGILHVEAEGLSEVTVYNLLGQPVMRLQGADGRADIATSGLSQGIYTVSANTVNGVVTKRFTVMH